MVSSAIASSHRNKISKTIINENITGWLFILPNLIGYFAFKMFPILFSLILSFCNWNFLTGLQGVHFIGLENYARLWGDTWFLKSLINTLVYAFVTVPVGIMISLLLSVVLNDKIFLKGVVRLGFYIPNIASTVAVTVVWSILYMDIGPINMFLRSIGIANPPGWVNSTTWALPSIMIISVWQVIGYNAIILLAGLQGIPKQLYESAEIEGANAAIKFFKITIPMLSSTLFFVIVISIINSFQVFTQVNIMTQGGPGTSTTVLVFYIYNTAFKYNRIGYANAIGWVLFLLVFIVTAIQWKFSKKESYID
jgi:multiple sugar transport system permease protein